MELEKSASGLGRALEPLRSIGDYFRLCRSCGLLHLRAELPPEAEETEAVPEAYHANTVQENVRLRASVYYFY